VLADQLKSLDWKAGKAAFEVKAPQAVLARAQELIKILLGE